jgi:hypothetical protein
MVGTKLLATASLGEVQEVSAVDRHGTGMALTAQKETPDNFASGMSMGELSIPNGSLVVRRRLTASCSQVTLQQTTYHQTNIYRWASAGSLTVPSDATLNTVEVSCSPAGTPSSTQVVITVTATPPPGGSDGLQPVCVVFDNAAGQWTTQGVEWVNQTALTCLTTLASGTYTVAWQSGYPLPSGLADEAGVSAGALVAIIIIAIFGICFAVLICAGVVVKNRQSIQNAVDKVGLNNNNNNKNNKQPAAEDVEAAMEDQLYLPITVGNATVLISEGDGVYRVDHGNLPDITNPGVAFRTAKDMTSTHPTDFAGWDTRVKGTDEGDGWLKVLERSPQEVEAPELDVLESDDVLEEAGEQDFAEEQFPGRTMSRALSQPQQSGRVAPYVDERESTIQVGLGEDTGSGEDNGNIEQMRDSSGRSLATPEEPAQEPPMTNIVRDESGDIAAYQSGDEWVECV